VKLTIFAALDLDFLAKVTRVKTVKITLELSTETATILDSVATWLHDFNILQIEMVRMDSETEHCLVHTVFPPDT